MHLHSTPFPIIGLDIGKNIHVFATYCATDLSEIAPPMTIFNDKSGAQTLTRHIDDLLARYPVVWLGNEPTGIYYEALARHLQAHYAQAIAAGRLRYVFVNPHLVKLARQALQNGRFRKSDAIDTQAIARCLQQGQYLPARLPTGQSLLFSQWAGRFRALERERRQLQLSLLRQVDQLWPGAFVNVRRFQKAHPTLPPPVPLVQTRPLERKLVQAILTHCPNPHDVRTFTVEEMVEFLREYVGRGGEQTARKVLRNAHQALLPPPEVAAIYAENVSEDWTRYQACLERVETLQAQAETLVPASVAAVLLTVPGVSAYHAARYLAAVGDAQRFPSAAHVWSYAGFDPIYAQSGDTARVGKISRRGDPAFRDTLYLIGRSTSVHCAPIQAAFQRCYRGQSRRQVLATIHAARKANRLLYRLLITQEPYTDPI